jgi:O-antigen/teichoic acid export membrane protein
MTDIVSTVNLRIGNSVIFPFIASHIATERAELRNGLLGIRAKFLGLAGFSMAVVITMSDFIIKALYDQRYQNAAWMLPILLIGTWFGLVSGLNEAALLGLGKPKYSMLSNGAKVGFLVVALQPSFDLWGPRGIIIVVALSDLCRYAPTCVGLRRARFSFIWQDLVFTVGMGSCLALFEWLRWVLGFGTTLDALLQ